MQKMMKIESDGLLEIMMKRIAATKRNQNGTVLTTARLLPEKNGALQTIVRPAKTASTAAIQGSASPVQAVF